jgi:hypothetical protein
MYIEYGPRSRLRLHLVKRNFLNQYNNSLDLVEKKSPPSRTHVLKIRKSRYVIIYQKIILSVFIKKLPLDLIETSPSPGEAELSESI